MSLHKTDVPGYAKDARTGAIVAVDVASYEVIRQSREKSRRQRAEIDSLRSDVRELKEAVAKLIGLVLGKTDGRTS